MACQTRLNAFDVNRVGHQSPGLWAPPTHMSGAVDKGIDHRQDTARRMPRHGMVVAAVIGCFPDRSLISMSGRSGTGLGLGPYVPTDMAEKTATNAIHSLGESARSGRGRVFPGARGRIADMLQEQGVIDTDAGGFDLAYAVTPGGFEDDVTPIPPDCKRAAPTVATRCAKRRLAKAPAATSRRSSAGRRGPRRC